MALADVYDALISKRVYKPPMPHEKAVTIIVEGQGNHFDPDMVDAFLALESTFRNIALTFADYEEERQMLGGGGDTGAKERRPVEYILLVEDNEINLEIMQSQLVSLGYRVDAAVDGRQALSKYQQADYDVILTDLEMPEMDGYALTTEIRRSEAGSPKSTPILAITASDFDLSEERARSLGFDGYMLKPLDPDLLQKKLAAVVSAEHGEA